MKDKYGVFDLGLDESQNRLISPEYTTPMEALRRLADVFDDHDAQPQIYAVKNIATGVIIGKVRRNVAALKVQREQRLPVLITRFRVWLQTLTLYRCGRESSLPKFPSTLDVIRLRSQCEATAIISRG